MIVTTLPSGDNYGWGICGSNLNKELAKLTQVMPLSTVPDAPVAFDQPVLHAVSGPTFMPSNLNVWSRTRNVGLAFIEDMEMARRYKENALRFYDHIICGSTWCANELAKLGLSTSVAIQGVDQKLFYPIPDKPKHKRFNIGSFGKFEYRKGQDVVIAAFKQIYKAFPEAHLIAGWGNLWPETMKSMVHSKYIRYVSQTADISDWKNHILNVMYREDIPRDRYTLIDLMPQHETAFAYHRCDIAVFPNRVEAGTNMPLMECIACGIPTICTHNTGHEDISGASCMIFDGSPSGLVEMIETFTSGQVYHAVRSQFSTEYSWANTAKSVLEAVNNYELKHS